jgi:hypothetical protein
MLCQHSCGVHAAPTCTCWTALQVDLYLSVESGMAVSRPQALSYHNPRACQRINIVYFRQYSHSIVLGYTRMHSRYKP